MVTGMDDIMLMMVKMRGEELMRQAGQHRRAAAIASHRAGPEAAGGNGAVIWTR